MNTSFKNGTEDDMREQLRVLREDFSKLSSTAAAGIAHGVNAAGSHVASSARAARNSTIEAVAANPFAAVGIAAGVGFLIGLFMRR